MDQRTCPECGAVLPPKAKPEMIYCSRVCGYRHRSRLRYHAANGYAVGDVRQCLICSAKFVSERMTHKLCSDACVMERTRSAARRAYHKAHPPKPPKPTECRHAHCDRPVRRGGMCDRCYQAQRKWANVPIGPQPVKLILPKRPKVAPREHGTVRGYNQHRKYGEPQCADCMIAPRIASRKRGGVTQPTSCIECGQPIPAKDDTDPTWASRYCGDTCKDGRRRRVARESPSRMRAKRKYRAKRRAVERGSSRFAERFDPLEVFERDHWMCQCCRRKVDRRKVHPHRRAPVLDHIVPISKGGEHTRANTQLLCSGCNAAKSDGAANDQLRLIG